MGFLLVFGLLYMGYTLIDWGHYVFKHEPVSLWYLMSGSGDRLTKAGTISNPKLPNAPSAQPPGQQQSPKGYRI